MLNGGYEVTVLSRNKNVTKGAISLIEERESGVKQLNGNHYDLIIDFICYDGKSVNEVFANVSFDSYILISTVWLLKLEETKVHSPTDLSLETKRYLHGKKEAEEVVNKARMNGLSATSIRLPILSGHNDHTKRLMFYLNRIMDRGGVIRVNGGENIVQIANSKDVADAIALAGTNKDLTKEKLWDAMPKTGITVKYMLNTLSCNHTEQWCDVSDEYLRRKFPEYLEIEPFWKEYQLPINQNNIFELTNTEARPFEEWVKPLKSHVETINNDTLRDMEKNFIKQSL